ncbi:MAG TPA: DUF3551 domain-containing protein [Xanthobacteraceae bacterium]|nr:DUF3551 domain-containing protein [Xanthobacteraceae bacterium]
MHRSLLLVLAAAPMLSAQVPLASARASYFPWCAHYGGDDFGGAISCGFATHAQCMASLSGVGGTCERNVLPPPATSPRAAANRNRR